MGRDALRGAGCPAISVIVPVHNGGAAFARCLAAIQRHRPGDSEVIVADDASTDRSGDIAAGLGVRVVRLEKRSGPAAARNRGAAEARGAILCFIDADCEIHADSIGALANVLRTDDQLDAVFGSYDDEPAAPGFFAQYKNLVHHWVHQRGNREASTFWAGLGAIRRDTFVRAGGFDERRYARPAIEDIELGMRIRAAGGRIRLAPEIQAKHHKAWTFTGVLASDIRDRAVPWTRLLRERRDLPNALNLNIRERTCAILVWTAIATAAAAVRWLPALAIAGALLAPAILLNRDLYAFLARKRGLAFTIGAIAMHLLYYAYSLATFAVVFAWCSVRRRPPRS